MDFDNFSNQGWASPKPILTEPGVKYFLHSSFIESGILQARSDIILSLLRATKRSRDYYTLTFVKLKVLYYRNYWIKFWPKNKKCEWKLVTIFVWDFWNFKVKIFWIHDFFFLVILTLLNLQIYSPITSNFSSTAGCIIFVAFSQNSVEFR